MTASNLPIDIIDFRAERYSPDGKSIIVSFATAQSAERRTYALPVQSIYGFIADLQRMQPGAKPAVPGAPAPAAQKAAVPAPAAHKAATPTPARTDGAGAPTRTDAAATRIEVSMPKRWMVRPLPERNVVVMVFDPQTERQAAYALPAASIREMADVLVKQADTLEKPAPGKATAG